MKSAQYEKFVHHLCSKHKLDLQAEVKEFVAGSHNDWSLRTWIQNLCLLLDVEEAQVKSQTRKREVAYKRHVICYVLTKTTLFTIVDIGLILGGRNHATVIHSREFVQDALGNNRWITQLFEKVKHLT